MNTPRKLAELTPMGWSCAECGLPFAHGRELIAHLLAEHPELDPTREIES